MVLDGLTIELEVMAKVMVNVIANVRASKGHVKHARHEMVSREALASLLIINKAQVATDPVVEPIIEVVIDATMVIVSVELEYVTTIEDPACEL